MASPIPTFTIGTSTMACPGDVAPLPSTLFELSFNLRRLRNTPARKPRTECCCQPVVFHHRGDLGYAGLGATALGNEPADWMSAVLRGRSFPLEHCLGVLPEAMKNQLPPHVDRMPSGPAHDVDTHI
jgi:hypothetical protein